MKYVLTGTMALIIALSATLAGAATPIDRIVAVVNDDIILNSELEDRIELIRQRMQPGTNLPSSGEFRSQVLDQIINETLQIQRARQAGLQISDDQVNQAMAQLARRNDTTLDRLPQVLASQGLEYSAVREQVRRELIQQQVQQGMLYREVTVSDQEVQEFLAAAEARGDFNNEYRVSHIMIASDDGGDSADRDARSEAMELYQQLQDGTEFSQLAVNHSDSRTALDGGDLGWRPGPELPTVFAEKVANLGEGEITEPFRTSSGYHILKLEQARRDDPVIVDEFRARHILLRPSEVLLPSEARIRLASLREQVQNGADFAELAREHSQDPGSAAQGGDLGWQGPGQLVPAFEEKMRELSLGEISEPFETQFGWHIVQLLETRERDRTLDARRNQAQQYIRARKADQRMEGWLQQLRDEAYIEIRLGE